MFRLICFSGILYIGALCLVLSLCVRTVETTFENPCIIPDLYI